MLKSPLPSSPLAFSSLSSVPTLSSYLFPTTVIQVPIATVCPDTPASSALFSMLTLPPLSSMQGTDSTNSSRVGVAMNATNYLPIRVNATALLPNGSTTVFLSTSTTSVARLVSPTTNSTSSASSSIINDTTSSPSAAETARIVLDHNGCQTVYSALTTRHCSTTIQPAGILPVPITDCDQWVTFSSDRFADACSTTASAAEDTSTTIPEPEPESESSSTTISGPAAFYAAHWYDFLHGPVPTLVRVEDFVPAPSGSSSCLTSSEFWSVATSTLTSTTTTVASFQGVSFSLSLFGSSYSRSILVFFVLHSTFTPPPCCCIVLI